jgi:hypothetical protein
LVDHLEPLWKLLTDKSDEATIQRQGQTITHALDSEIASLTRQKRILEEIMGWKAPMTKAWESLTNMPVGDPFAEAVHASLKEVIAEGKRKVDTALIYRMVVKRGVQNGRKNPRTAIGNMVIRTPGWKKVTSGVYEYLAIEAKDALKHP